MPGLIAPGGCTAAGAVSRVIAVSGMVSAVSGDSSMEESVLVFCPLPQAVSKAPERPAASSRYKHLLFIK